MRPDGLVLAVDGGGVKTDLALLDTDGHLVSFVRGGRSQAHYLGVEGCINVLQALLESALNQAGLAGNRGFAAAQILLAGADLPEERSALRGAIGQLGWSPRLNVDNDTVALLRSGTDRGWGVAVVCGAGINCFGQARDGRQARFLSLGEISGDWGGGGDVGLAAVSAAARSADGRGPRTALATKVPAHFGMSDPLEVSRAIHLREIPMARLAELAPVVFAAAEEDPVAASLLNRLADEVIAFAGAGLRRLELTQADPDVVLGGSLLRALPPGLVDTITRGVEAVAPRANVLMAPSEPVVGAALLALDDLDDLGGGGAAGGAAAAAERARAELGAALVRTEAGATERSSPSETQPLLRSSGG